MARKQFSFGSIISGTLKASDLIPEFCAEWGRRFHPKKRISNWLEDLSQCVKAVDVIIDDEAVTEAFYNSEYALSSFESLKDALDADLPPFVYFGTHPGDGSDFGYWFDQDSFETSVHDGETIKVENLPDSPGAFHKEYPDAYQVAVISDHGNIEMYGIVRHGKGFRFVNYYGIV